MRSRSSISLSQWENTRTDAARVSVIPTGSRAIPWRNSEVISRDVSTSLDMTKSEGCAALPDLVSRNLELVAVGIAEINRVRDFVILEFEFDSVLLEFTLRTEEVFVVCAKG